MYRDFTVEIPSTDDPAFLTVYNSILDSTNFSYVGYSVTDNVIVFTRSNGTTAVVNVCPSPTLTDQSAKDECDINKIIKRFVSAGVPLPKPRDDLFVDQTAYPDFHQSVHLMHAANENFSSLPPHIIEKFDSDPSKFMRFCNDPKNKQQLIDLGLYPKDESSPAPESKSPDKPPDTVDDDPKTRV